MFEYGVIVLAGFCCGLLNTLASSGSVVTLPLLMFLGLTPEMANGTNRVPVLMGSVIAIFLFVRAGAFHWPTTLKIVIPASMASLAGAYFAEQIPSRYLGLLITLAVLIAMILLLTKIKKVLEKVYEEEPRLRWQEIFLVSLVGFWLGFIVLDGATYLMLALLLGIRLPFVEATAIKNLVIASATAIALLFFASKGHVDWYLGGIMAAGSVVGGVVGAKMAMMPMAKIWTYRLLILIIILELMHLGTQYYHEFMAAGG